MTQQDQPSRWTTVAELLRPQGRKGELLADLLTDFPERFAAGARVFLVSRRRLGVSISAIAEKTNSNPSKPDHSGTGPVDNQPRAYLLEGHWLPQGKNAGRVVLKFAGVDSINDAELLKGREVVVPREERKELDADAEYISDLVGCTVFNGSSSIGVVEDVEFAAEHRTGVPETAPLLVVRNEAGDEILVPFAKAWLRKMDVEAHRIEMELPEGLLGINASGS